MVGVDRPDDVASRVARDGHGVPRGAVSRWTCSTVSAVPVGQESHTAFRPEDSVVQAKGVVAVRAPFVGPLDVPVES